MRPAEIVRKSLVPAFSLAFLAGVAVFSSDLVERKFRESSEALGRAGEVRFLASEILRLVLQQDDATKSMIISPDKLAEVSEAKIAAFDKQHAFMKELEEKTRSDAVRRILGELKDLEEGRLRTLDEGLLETLLGGDPAEATRKFFAEYAPAREAYAQLVEELKKVAEENARLAVASLEDDIADTRAMLLTTFAVIAALFAGVLVLNVKREMARRDNDRLAVLVRVTLGLVAARDFPELLLTIHRHLPLLQREGERAVALWLLADDGLDSGPGAEAHEIRGSVCVAATGRMPEVPDDVVFGEGGVVSVPLRLGENVLGGLELRFTVPREDDKEERAFLQSLALAVAQSAQALVDARRRERDAALIREKERETRLVLESMSDGLLAVDTEGRARDIRSKAFETWFGAPSPGARLAEVLFPEPSRARESFAFLFEQLCLDVLPFDVAASQLPSRLALAGATLDVEYQPVETGGTLHEILVSFKDVSARVELESKERGTRDVLAFLEVATHAPGEARSFLAEMDRLVEAILAHDPGEVVVLGRLLHTAKGSSGVFGLQALSSECHAIEDAFLEEGRLQPPLVERLRAAWAAFGDRVRPFVSGASDDDVRVPRSKLAELVARANDAAGRDAPEELRRALPVLLDALTRDPLEAKLVSLQRQAAAVAARLGKDVGVTQACGDLGLPHGEFDSFFASLVHVVRNAVDHGIEESGTRVAKGKPEAGNIAFTAGAEGGDLVVRVSDDGGGIDWERVRAKALSKGLPASSREDLVLALFHDGVSTRDAVTEMSGRGVGLSAVREECLALGGVIDVDSVVGKGTTFVFRFAGRAAGYPDSVAAALAPGAGAGAGAGAEVAKAG